MLTDEQLGAAIIDYITQAGMVQAALATGPFSYVGCGDVEIENPDCVFVWGTNSAEQIGAHARRMLSDGSNRS